MAKGKKRQFTLDIPIAKQDNGKQRKIIFGSLNWQGILSYYLRSQCWQAFNENDDGIFWWKKCEVEQTSWKAICNM